MIKRNLTMMIFFKFNGSQLPYLTNYITIQCVILVYKHKRFYTSESLHQAFNLPINSNSAHVERLFSVGGLSFEDRIGSMADSTPFEKTLLLKFNKYFQLELLSRIR